MQDGRGWNVSQTGVSGTYPSFTKVLLHCILLTLLRSTSIQLVIRKNTWHSPVLSFANKYCNYTINKEASRVISGRKFGGHFDGFYGKLAERIPYDLEGVKESLAGRAVQTTASPLPEPEAWIALRAQATVSCGNSSKYLFFLRDIFLSSPF